MKRRDPGRSPPVAAADYGRALRGIGFNLLVSEVPRSVAFATEVLGATSFYDDADFAALRWNGQDFMFHADHSYSGHPLSGVVAGVAGRGAGVELRLYGCDPDAAEAKARDLGFTILSGAADKPHGLRECVILDDDGYARVPSVPLRA